jgi:hypothetical protein
MAAAAQPVTSLTLGEYLRSAFHPDCDFVDGDLEVRNAGEYEHSTIQIALGAWFFIHRAEWNIRIASEYRAGVAPSRILIPNSPIFLDLPELFSALD